MRALKFAAVTVGTAALVSPAHARRALSYRQAIMGSLATSSSPWLPPNH
jgi:hypothetical protein